MPSDASELLDVSFLSSFSSSFSSSQRLQFNNNDDFSKKPYLTSLLLSARWEREAEQEYTCQAEAT
jgi:hypothetical protein